MSNTEEGIEIGEAQIGKGLFTKRSFEAGASLATLKGVLIPVPNIHGTVSSMSDNTIRYSKEYYLSPAGELGDFLNHSCEPNARIEQSSPALSLIAITNIPSDTEVTIDYSTVLADDDPWSMKCFCGAGACRSEITKFNLLPEALQKRYTAEKIVPHYILNEKN
jgi:hypothetical protein